MPYERLADLPEGVTNNLPKHAQEIYFHAFNSAWEQYKHSQDRRGDENREAVAHKVAWSAVKQKYHQDSHDNWVRK